MVQRQTTVEELRLVLLALLIPSPACSNVYSRGRLSHKTNLYSKCIIINTWHFTQTWKYRAVSTAWALTMLEPKIYSTSTGQTNDSVWKLDYIFGIQLVQNGARQEYCHSIENITQSVSPFSKHLILFKVGRRSRMSQLTLGDRWTPTWIRRHLITGPEGKWTIFLSHSCSRSEPEFNRDTHTDFEESILWLKVSKKKGWMSSRQQMLQWQRNQAIVESLRIIWYLKPNSGKVTRYIHATFADKSLNWNSIWKWFHQREEMQSRWTSEHQWLSGRSSMTLLLSLFLFSNLWST